MRWIFIALILLLSGCIQPRANLSQKQDDGQMNITSSAFAHTERIPRKYTCQGNDINPPLSWTGVPQGTQSLVLIVDDPDAPRGTWVHWVVWNIPADTKMIAKGNEPEGIQGKTDFGTTGYGGPCPPSGIHRYFFKIYALDVSLNLREGSTKKDLENAMKGHIMEKAELVGLYKRR